MGSPGSAYRFTSHTAIPTRTTSRINEMAVTVRPSQPSESGSGFALKSPPSMTYCGGNHTGKSPSAHLLLHRLHDDGGAVSQDLGDALHDFGGVVTGADYRIGAQFGGMLQHQVE